MDPLLGEIDLFSFNFAPQGWHLCDGTVLSIPAYTALYSLIGIQFGGDGKTTFALPRLLDASPIPGMQYYIAMAGIYPSRD